jgi:hypothetical protein
MRCVAGLAIACAVAVTGCAGGDEKPGAGETFTADNWAELVGDPSAHKGATVEIVGKVFTPPERDDGETAWQMWAKPRESEWNTVVSLSDPAFKVESGDFVRVHGEVGGRFEADNAFGAKITGVAIDADTAEVVDALAAAPPATATLDPRRATKASIEISVDRVELAATETRAFVTVRNQSRGKVSVFGNTAHLVAAGKQLEPTFASDYPQLGSDLVAGAETSGVIVFPAIETGRGVRLVLEGYAPDVDVGNFGSFTVEFSW